MQRACVSAKHFRARWARVLEVILDRVDVGDGAAAAAAAAAAAGVKTLPPTGRPKQLRNILNKQT